MNRQTLIIGVIVVCIILFLMSRTSAANSATPNNQPPNNQPYNVMDLFTPHLGSSCHGRNELGTYPAGTYSTNQCADLCADLPTCVSFETNDEGKCQLSTTCTPSTFNSSYPSWTTYMKN